MMELTKSMEHQEFRRHFFLLSEDTTVIVARQELQELSYLYYRVCQHSADMFGD